MALKKITSEDLVLNLILNADQVKDGNYALISELHKLDREVRTLETDLNKLEQDKRKLRKTDANYKNDLALLEKQMRQLRKEITQKRLAMDELRKQIGVTGMTINQLNSYLAALRIKLANATDPTLMKRLRAEIQQVSNRVERLRTGVSRLSQAWRQLGTVANKFGTLVGYVMIAVYGLSRAINSTTRNLRQLDRLFSNVMKTTGLTREEVGRLKREFDELDKIGGVKTPTKTADLLGIARIAGRLGVRGVEEIKAFTLAVDKMYVSLSTDLSGSVEEVTEKVGKLVNVFNLVGEEPGQMPLDQALLRTGSLINELGKRSAANAEAVLNYTSRLGGVGSMAGFTIDQLAGLGATLDANQVKAERGSTALVKLMVGIGKHAEEFAHAMGVPLEDFRKMVEEDVNAVFIKLMELANSGNGSIIDVVNSMDKMHVSGVRVAETFGKLRSSIEMVKEQQEIAKAAFSSSASVMNEYYIVAQDFDALMAIQGKRAKALADDYSKVLGPAMLKVYSSILDFAFAIQNAWRWLKEHNKVIKLTIALLVMLKARMVDKFIVRYVFRIGELVSMWWKHLVAVRANAIAMRGILVDAYVKAGKGMKGLGAAFNSLAVIMGSGGTVVVALTAAVVALATAYGLLKKRADEVTTGIAKLDNEIQKEVIGLDRLFKSAQDAEEGTKERANAIKLINELYGKYLPRILTEADNNDTLADAQTRANAALKESIALKYMNDNFDETVSKKRNKRLKQQSKELKTIKDEIGAGAYGQAMFEMDELLEALYNEDNAGKRTELKQAFLDKWNPENRGDFISRDDINLLYAMFTEEKEMLDSFSKAVDSYGKGLSDKIKKMEEEAPKRVVMTEEEYKDQLAEMEMEQDLELLMFRKSAIDKNKLQEDELKVKQKYLERKLELLRQYNTAYVEIASGEKAKKFQAGWGDLYETVDEAPGAVKQSPTGYYKVPTGGEKDILDAQIKLQDNLDSQQSEFDKEMEANQLENDRRKLDLMKKFGADKEKLQLAELKSDEKFLRQSLQMYIDKWTTEAGDVMDKGAAEILAAEIKLEENRIAQIEAVRGKTKKKDLEKERKEEYQTEENYLLELYANGVILKEEYEIRLLQEEREYNKDMIAIAKKAGIDYLDYEKAYFEARLKLRKKFEEQAANVKSATAWAFSAMDEQQEKEATGKLDQSNPMYSKDDDIAIQNYIKQKNKIRQFLNLDKDQEQEKEFAVFDTENFAGQLDQLKEWYDRGIILREEYERKQTEITREQNKYRMKLTQQALGYVNDLLSASASYYEAQKQRELDAAGKSKRKQEQIEKKYAKKEQRYKIAQAHIAGAMAIMNLWGNNTMPYPAAAIFNGIMTAIIVATTMQNIATIKAQQFAKGKYPVMGKDDGRTYNAEYVGKPKTGIYQRPSLGLFAEKPEMVIDNTTLRNIQMNSPGLIQAILAHRTGTPNQRNTERVKQYASGNYDVAPMGNEAKLMDLIERNTKAMEAVQNMQIWASFEEFKKVEKRQIQIAETRRM